MLVSQFWQTELYYESNKYNKTKVLILDPKLEIPFNKPITEFFDASIISQMSKFSGDGDYTKKCHNFFETAFKTQKALLTTSCTHALEMAAILLDIRPGDEVIMPSYTFVSTANAFVLRGAKIIFVDIRPDTMNIDEALIETAITKKTKAIIPVHYAGVPCEMDTIMEIAKRHDLYVVEDAAQGVMSKYKGKFLGTIGDLGTFSFHETKNYHCGEGGALLINNPKFIERAEVIREKGTNRSRFFRGQVDKYTWVDVGSSYLPSELNAAYLFSQLTAADQINQNRLDAWQTYSQKLNHLVHTRSIELPHLPVNTEHNAHMFYIKVQNLKVRTELIHHLKQNGVSASFHYVPLHSSPAGIKYGHFHGNDNYTTLESDRLLRLPLWFGISMNELSYVCEKIESFK
jgi:dTDP-4-amino-4,6-dideoxygalactose transaminase